MAMVSSKVAGIPQMRNSMVGKKRMRANIPPDSFAIVDAACLDERLDIGVEVARGGEYFWYTAAREGFPDDRAIRLEAGKVASQQGELLEIASKWGSQVRS